MDAGSFICLGLLSVQLGMQIREVFKASRNDTKRADPAPRASDTRRAFLDQKAEIERDARRRL